VVMSALGRLGLVLVLLVTVSCTDAPAEVPITAVPPAPGAPEASTAVDRLLAAVTAGDYATASDLTVDSQMVAIAVTENASVEALHGVLATGGRDIGANYWESFAATIEEFMGASTFTVGNTEAVSIEGVDFALVDVNASADLVGRRFVAQRLDDGWKIDVVATFAPAMAQRLGRTADSLRADPTAEDILAAIIDQRHSLEVALRDAALEVDTIQLIRTAIVSLGG